MRKRLVLLGIIIAVVAVAMSSLGVASAGGGETAESEWRSVDATLQLSDFYYPGGIIPLNEKSTESLDQYENPFEDKLEGRFEVLSTFSGDIYGDFGLEESVSGSVQADLTSTLNVDLDLEGGTESGVTRGDVTLYLGNDDTINGRVVGNVDLEMGGLYQLPSPPYPAEVYLHELVGGKLRLVFFITGGSGAFEGAHGMLTIKGDPIAGASVEGKIKLAVPTDS